MADWLVWYSIDANEVYHLYFDCYDRERILATNLRVKALGDVRGSVGLRLCSYCADMLREGSGQYVCGDVIGGNSRDT